MAISVKDATNTTNSLKTTFDGATATHTPHHLVDGTTAVSGNIVVTSGLIGATGTIAVSGNFPSGVQYAEGSSEATKVGTAALGEKPDGKVLPLQQNASGHLFVEPKHPHSEPEKMFNSVLTLSSDSAQVVKAAPSNTANRYYITSFSASNASSTGTIFSMFSHSTNNFNAFVAESGGGVAMTMPTPIVCGTGEAIKASLSVATQNVLVTVQGYMDL